jgi:hypothetical protein
MRGKMMLYNGLCFEFEGQEFRVVFVGDCSFLAATFDNRVTRVFFMRDLQKCSLKSAGDSAPS